MLNIEGVLNFAVKHIDGPPKDPEIAELYKSGLSVAQVAARVGLCPATVRLRIPENYMRTAGRPRGVAKPSLVAEAVALYQTGLTMKQVAEKLQVSRDWVSRLMPDDVQRRKGPIPQIASVRNETIKTEYLSGKTLGEVGETHGITRERVRQVLRKLGVWGGPHHRSAAVAQERGERMGRRRALILACARAGLHRRIAYKTLGFPHNASIYEDAEAHEFFTVALKADRRILARNRFTSPTYQRKFKTSILRSWIGNDTRKAASSRRHKELWADPVWREQNMRRRAEAKAKRMAERSRP